MKDTIIQRALRFATKAHEGQKRDFTGVPYITHPIDVAQIIVEEFKIADPEVIASAYLLDSINNKASSYRHSINLSALSL